MKSNENKEDILGRLQECVDCYTDDTRKSTQENEQLLENTISEVINLLSLENQENKD